MKTASPKVIALVLLCIVLLPAIFYSGYEITALTRSEQLLASIYSRQLDAILYSVNQYAWDVTSSWTNQLSLVLDESSALPLDTVANRSRSFVLSHTSIAAVAVTDTLGSTALFEVEGIIVHSKFSARLADTVHTRAILEAVTTNAEKLNRLIRYKRSGYRKLEPITIAVPDNPTMLGLVFVTGERVGKPVFAILVVDEPSFTRDFLANKLTETAGDEFILGILRTGEKSPFFSTDAVDSAGFLQTKELWSLPRMSVGIRLRGETVEEVVRARFKQNIVLIVLLDVVLAIGAWFVYRSMKKELALVRLKSDFVSNVSHELRTPLALIRMYAETLEMGRVKDEAKRNEYYGTILNESERLTRLVNNILNFSRIDAGRKEYHKAPADLNAIVSAVLASYGAHLEAEGFHPVVELDQSLPQATVDAEAVTEAVINLVDNAVKYSGAQRYLRIATLSRGGVVTISVEDHGIGIAPEHHSKIFETFYRVSSGLVHNTKGSGLGLALVKHIMDAHGGKVVVQSSLEKGSTFILEFPL